MNSSKLTRGAFAAIALAASALLSPVQAAPTLSVVATPSPIVGFGATVTVDIFVSGLTQAIGAYVFDLDYDTSRMSLIVASILADPDDKMGSGLDVSFPPAGSQVNFNVLAGLTDPLDEPVLAGIQGAGFRLGTVQFTALNNEGFANFSLSGYSLSDYSGTNGIPDQVAAMGAQVCVSRDGQTPCDSVVPEPTTALLAAIALGGLAFSRRRQPAV